MEWTPFAEVAAVLAVGAVIGAAGLKLRQPLIISFLFTGIIVGPSALGMIKDANDIELLASIGISLLLFVVGLRLDVGMIRTVGPVALATGLGQVILTFMIGFAIAIAFGMTTTTSIYVAVAITFSSTIIVVKLLSDKNEIDSLHGRIAVGILIVQDLVAILALIGLAAFGGSHQEQGLLAGSLQIVGNGLLMLATIIVLMRWGLPWTLKYISKSQELLVLFAITWAILLASTAELLGFNKEVGAFLAGVSLASTEQRDAIGAKLVVLRDFLLLFFFINLGAQLDISDLGAELGRAFVFSAFILIGKPLIVMPIMGVMGYRKRTGFMSGLAIAQISEFSLILAALGLSLGHIDASAINLITLVALITIFASTYSILYSSLLYNCLSRILGIFEHKNPHRESNEGIKSITSDDYLIVVLGLGNYGLAIASHLKQHNWHLVAVDFDPHALERGRSMGLPVSYGDFADPEMISQLPLERARWVLCTVRNRALSLSLLNLLREKNFTGRIAMTAGDSTYTEEYYRLGANLVLQPFKDAAEQAAEEVTGAIQALPGLRDWPVTLKEISLLPGSVLAGKNLQELDLRRKLGVSVLAISRAGKVHFNPSYDFQLYPGDRIVLLCTPEQATLAVEHFRQRELGAPQEQTNALNADEITVSPESPWVGKNIAEIDFRNRYGVMVIGIRRGLEQLTSPRASDVLQAYDSVVVVGSPEGVAMMKVS